MRLVLLLLLLFLWVITTDAQFFPVFAEPGQGLDTSGKIKALEDRIVDLEQAMAGVILLLRRNLMQFGIDDWTGSFWEKHQHLDAYIRYNKLNEERKRKEEDERLKREEEMRVKRYEEMREACGDIYCDWLSQRGRKECCATDGSVMCNLDEGTPSEYYDRIGIMINSSIVSHFY